MNNILEEYLAIYNTPNLSENELSNEHLAT